MDVCIHRGTQEIGGNCVEVVADDARMLLDPGPPRDLDVLLMEGTQIGDDLDLSDDDAAAPGPSEAALEHAGEEA